MNFSLFDNYDWSGVELDFGRKFPNDYKGLMERFGEFEFSDFIAVSTPRDIVEYNHRLQGRLSEKPFPGIRLDREKSFLDEAVLGVEFVAFTDVVEWADTQSNLSLCWHAVGAPDAWRVLVTDFYDCYYFPWGAEEMLGFLARSDEGANFADSVGWPRLEMTFNPSSEDR
ncbi:hypothetical protein ABZ512_19825 [Nocardiopsis dassonvillei]|uniref:hypothetical protein n=1 Tax=Nocardiopsis dassonvillei TaxID=2014 RepID=UPI0033F6167B